MPIIWAFQQRVSFQFTPLREGRLKGTIRNIKSSLFQFTPLREGRREAPSGRVLRGIYFNSRPCVRGDTENQPDFCSEKRFQFTPLREGRPFPLGKYTLRVKFQFTPLREGRPVPYRCFRLIPAYFNSRPCVRGDTRSTNMLPRMTNFNSRPCVRGDP